MAQQIYAMSDIHGYLDAFDAALAKVPLTQSNVTLLIMSDLIDGGPQSCQVLARVKALCAQYPEKVHFLIGNHDVMFLDLLASGDRDWLAHDQKLITTQSFLDEAEWRQLVADLRTQPWRIVEFIQAAIIGAQPELIRWLDNQRGQLFYETATQIFVHAGVDESMGDYWRGGTDRETFYWKYPATTGKFGKMIIAGHVGSAEVAHDAAYLGHIYWDGASHIFIDGTVKQSGVVPVLHYDGATGRYGEVGDKGEEELK
jgi:serine/threonine protein phosphatase 1